MDKHPRYNDLLTTLEVLQPKDSGNTSYDTIMGFALDKVTNDVANYTHLPIAELPEALDMTIVSLVNQLINTHQLLTTVEDKVGNVKSLSEGDTSVTFQTPAEAYAAIQSVNSVTDDYRSQLNSFRVVQR